MSDNKDFHIYAGLGEAWGPIDAAQAGQHMPRPVDTAQSPEPHGLTLKHGILKSKQLPPDTQPSIGEPYTQTRFADLACYSSGLQCILSFNPANSTISDRGPTSSLSLPYAAPTGSRNSPQDWFIVSLSSWGTQRLLVTQR